jgi:uncharacterized protein (TIGR03435 family)
MLSRIPGFAFLLLLFAFHSGIATAQAVSNEPSFEVVSIRPTAPDQQRWAYREFPDRVTLRANVWALIADAYGTQLRNIVGGPGWIKSEYYDVNATFGEEVTAKLATLSPHDRMNEIMHMLQPVLQQRFGLKAHHETREVPVFALVLAKGGPKFSPATPPQNAADIPRLAFNGHQYTFHRAPMSMVALGLSQIPQVGREVIDQTGLTGGYTFSFDWSAKTNPDESVFTAITDQLGLKLEPTKAPVDFVIVDDIQRPSEN